MKEKTVQRHGSHNSEANDRGSTGEPSKSEGVTPEQTNHAESLNLEPIAELLTDLATMKEFIEDMSDGAA